MYAELGHDTHGPENVLHLKLEHFGPPGVAGESWVGG